MPEHAKCRGCGKKLGGTPYHLGGHAYDPDTGEAVKACHYGGWVCSRECDVRACVELEGTMPGCRTVNQFDRLSCFAKDRIRDNWRD
jgi:hypothetical protein